MQPGSCLMGVRSLVLCSIRLDFPTSLLFTATFLLSLRELFQVLFSMHILLSCGHFFLLSRRWLSKIQSASQGQDPVHGRHGLNVCTQARARPKPGDRPSVPEQSRPQKGIIDCRSDYSTKAPNSAIRRTKIKASRAKIPTSSRGS